MKTLLQVILEQEESNEDRSKLKFIIYKDDGTTVDWLGDDEAFQKIECVFEEKPDFDEGIKISFLLGKGDDGKWKLWAGKPGVITYSDDPYKELKTKKFDDAVLQALDEAEELIKKVRKEPNNWVQFYI